MRLLVRSPYHPPRDVEMGPGVGLPRHSTARGGLPVGHMDPPGHELHDQRGRPKVSEDKASFMRGHKAGP